MKTDDRFARDVADVILNRRRTSWRFEFLSFLLTVAAVALGVLLGVGVALFVFR